METVAASQDPKLAEDLMRFLMNMEDRELFAAMLYTCYELVQPDVALEVAWRFGLMEYVMPYFIQFVKDISTRIDQVKKSTEDIKKKDEKQEQEAMSQPLDFGMAMDYSMFPGFNTGPQVQAIMPQPGAMPNMGGMGGGMGGFGGGYQYQ